MVSTSKRYSLILCLADVHRRSLLAVHCIAIGTAFNSFFTEMLLSSSFESIADSDRLLWAFSTWRDRFLISLIMSRE